MKTVKELATLAGVSVRTLHYYDQIGLLRPAGTTPSGYRLYGEREFSRLQQILFFRELDFPLEEIRAILDSPSFDKAQALDRQRELLSLERDRLDRLIALVDALRKGEKNMTFDAFDRSELDTARARYAEEARERWGNTPAYAESEQKARDRSDEDWARISRESDEILQGFASCRGKAPRDPAVAALVSAWQEHITRNYYACSKEILQSLGEMYVSDERFTKNLERYGEGVARLMSEAIAAYCEE